MCSYQSDSQGEAKSMPVQQARLSSEEARAERERARRESLSTDPSTKSDSDGRRHKARPRVKIYQGGRKPSTSFETGYSAGEQSPRSVEDRTPLDFDLKLGSTKPKSDEEPYELIIGNSRPRYVRNAQDLKQNNAAPTYRRQQARYVNRTPVSSYDGNQYVPLPAPGRSDIKASESRYVSSRERTRAHRKAQTEERETITRRNNLLQQREELIVDVREVRSELRSETCQLDHAGQQLRSRELREILDGLGDVDRSLVELPELSEVESDQKRLAGETIKERRARMSTKALELDRSNAKTDLNHDASLPQRAENIAHMNISERLEEFEEETFSSNEGHSAPPTAVLPTSRRLSRSRKGQSDGLSKPSDGGVVVGPLWTSTFEAQTQSNTKNSEYRFKRKEDSNGGLWAVLPEPWLLEPREKPVGKERFKAKYKKTSPTDTVQRHYNEEVLIESRASKDEQFGAGAFAVENSQTGETVAERKPRPERRRPFAQLNLAKVDLKKAEMDYPAAVGTRSDNDDAVKTLQNIHELDGRITDAVGHLAQRYSQNARNSATDKHGNDVDIGSSLPEESFPTLGLANATKKEAQGHDKSPANASSLLTGSNISTVATGGILAPTLPPRPDFRVRKGLARSPLGSKTKQKGTERSRHDEQVTAISGNIFDVLEDEGGQKKKRKAKIQGMFPAQPAQQHDHEESSEEDSQDAQTSPVRDTKHIPSLYPTDSMELEGELVTNFSDAGIVSKPSGLTIEPAAANDHVPTTDPDFARNALSHQSRPCAVLEASSAGLADSVELGVRGSSVLNDVDDAGFNGTSASQVEATKSTSDLADIEENDLLKEALRELGEHLNQPSNVTELEIFPNPDEASMNTSLASQASSQNEILNPQERIEHNESINSHADSVISFSVRDHHEPSSLDRMKLKIEKTLQQEILWWPLSDPLREGQTIRSCVRTNHSSIHQRNNPGTSANNTSGTSQHNASPCNPTQNSLASRFGPAQASLGSNNTKTNTAQNANTAVSSFHPCNIYFYLYLCINVGPDAPRVFEVEATGWNEDKLISETIRTYYSATRWRSLWTMTELGRIRFHKFTRLSDKHDHVSMNESCLPPATAQEWSVDRKASLSCSEDLISHHLQRHYKSDQLALVPYIGSWISDRLRHTCHDVLLPLIPKKSPNPLTRDPYVEGYGMLAIPQLALWRIVATMIVYLAIGLFYVIWRLLRTPDSMSDAFTPWTVLAGTFVLHFQVVKDAAKLGHSKVV